MRIKSNNKVILIGGVHHNGLGLVRQFGIHGIKPYGILISEKMNGWIEKSRYWEKIEYISSVNHLVDILLNNYSSFENKAVLIPYGDEPASIIDDNLDILRKFFICPSISNKQGEITRLMDKSLQTSFEIENGLNTLKTYVADLFQLESRDIKCPCIMKPVASIEGKKKDIQICFTEESVKSAVDLLIQKGYTRILIQDYLIDRRELCITGAITKTGYSFSISEVIRRWPNNFGVGSFKKACVNLKDNEYAKTIMGAIKTLGFVGIIDIEFFQDTYGEYYVNEINWRSSGLNHIQLNSKVFSAYDYYMEVTKNRPLINKINEHEFYVMDEKLDIRHLFVDKDIIPLKWIMDYIKTKNYAAWYWRDPAPALELYKRLIKNYFTK